MKLIACPECHTQFDVSEMTPDSAFDCRCGATLHARPPETTDAPIRRCGGCGAIAGNDDDSCQYCGSGILASIDRGSLICPECYARNLEEARFCLGCGVGFDPQSPRPIMEELRCPCCECWMASREVGGLEIYECPKCFGLWAPEDRFDLLIERAASAAAASEKSPEDDASRPRMDGGNPMDSALEYRRCPSCDALMHRRNFQKRSGVIVDQCHQHGTWLDAHELERIAGYVLSGRAARGADADATTDAEREKQAACEAALRIRDTGSDSRSAYAGFGHVQKSSAVSTIFDLLIGVLR